MNIDILGLGECLIELDANGTLTTAETYQRQVGGDVYNTLVGLSRLGNRAAFVSRVAMDGFGQVLLSHFEQNQVDTRYVRKIDSGANGVYFTSLNGDGSHSFLYYRQNSVASQLNVHQLNDAMFQGTRLVYATGVTQALSPGSREAVLKAFQLAKANGALVAYDPNYRPGLWQHRDAALEALVEVLPFVDVILPSIEDVQPLFNFKDVPHVMEYFRLREVPMVVLKLGKQGVALGFKNQSQYLEAHPMSTVKDSIGAGDAFNAGFLHGLLHQKSLMDCARRGLIVSALSLQETGPIRGLPDNEQVERLLGMTTGYTESPQASFAV